METCRATVRTPNYIMTCFSHCSLLDYHWRKGFPYKSSANIPLIVRWPTSAEKDTRLNITAQRASVNADRVVELRDVLPTVLDIANVPLPQGAKPRDGKPWTCLLNDPSGVSCDVIQHPTHLSSSLTFFSLFLSVASVS